MKRLPLVLACVLVMVKLTVIVVARVSPNLPSLLVQVARRDVPSMWAAEATTKLFFDQTRIFPTEPEAMFFDVALLLFTALEWYLCGIVVRWLLTRRRTNRRTPPVA